MSARQALLIPVAVLALAGCASAATGTTAAAPAASSATPAASSVMCTTKTCIAQDAQQSLTGMVAKDESVITGAKCRKATVKHNAGDTWTVSCTVTYSDGQQWRGLATLLPDQDKIAWEPTGTA